MAPGQCRRSLPFDHKITELNGLAMQATRLVTASEDDLSPVIMVWDLRNARAPEKVHFQYLRSRVANALHFCS